MMHSDIEMNLKNNYENKMNPLSIVSDFNLSFNIFFNIIFKL